jgi:hypothetical protein
MLIAHLYGWLYQQTGDVGYREKGDKIFKHGVEGAAKANPYLPYSKQFTQNYRLSLVSEWRGGRNTIGPHMLCNTRLIAST